MDDMKVLAVVSRTVALVVAGDSQEDFGAARIAVPQSVVTLSLLSELSRLQVRCPLRVHVHLLHMHYGGGRLVAHN